MRFVWWVVVNAAALGLAAWLLGGITVSARDEQHQLLTLLIVGVIFAVINSVLKPVVKVLSIPLIVLSLGLFLLVINALMLMLTSAIAHGIGVGFHVEGFWTAFWGSVIISLALMVLDGLLPHDDRSRTR